MKLFNQLNLTGEVLGFAKRSLVLKQTKNIPESLRKQSAKVIHTASVATGSVGAGLAQLPGTDAAVIVPIQVTMVLSLAKIYQIPLKESVAKIIVTETTATLLGRTASQFLVGWIPGVGNVINAGTAVALTETLGWIVATEFAKKADEIW
ncbi:MAG: hypothetical protein LKF42_06180 [Streptococcaceae bacterium]|nr:hypothetical protein [Streptococcaceae bacterium]MCH4177066.1 hypothetical protein [Streptococcaceae bacterium]